MKASAGASEQVRQAPPAGEVDPTVWRHSLRRKMFRPVKRSTTIRLDADVLDWLKAGGKGYQTRMNAILREAMRRDLS